MLAACVIPGALWAIGVVATRLHARAIQRREAERCNPTTWGPPRWSHF